MSSLLGITRTNYSSSVLDDGEHLEIFTLGGLESFKDVVTKRHQGLDGAEFSRVTPNQLPVIYDGRSHTASVHLTRS